MDSTKNAEGLRPINIPFRQSYQTTIQNYHYSGEPVHIVESLFFFFNTHTREGATYMCVMNP